MTRNLTMAFALQRIEIAAARAEQPNAYARLITEACAAVDRVERKRIARGTVPPTLAFTDAERAWFRSPVTERDS